MITSQLRTRGFTIIEVVLVLAIAGLIFLLIFLALPALQRNQRDQARRQDLGRLISAVGSFQTNNQGKRPADLGGTATGNIIGSTYLDNFNTPDGVAYTLVAGTLTTTLTPATKAPSAATVINYYVNKSCTDTSATTSSGKTAVVITMENSGQYCQTL